MSADLEDWISGLAGGEPSVRRLRKRLEATLDDATGVRSAGSRAGRQGEAADVDDAARLVARP